MGSSSRSDVSAPAQKGRSLLERWVSGTKPRWLPGFAPAPREVASGLWSVDRRIEIPAGPRLETRALLADLPDGGVLAWSPVPLDDALREFVRVRGGARFLVAPNSFHYLGLAEWQRAFPEAACWLAPGLPARVAGLPGGCELHTDVATPFQATLPHRALDCGRGATEVAFHHAPSRTLLIVDAAFNVRHAERWRDRAIWGALGVLGRFGPTPTARAFLLRDRAAIARWIDALCAWPFERIVMAHGEPLAAGPRELRAAFARYSS
jgi:hypothetical protein